MAVIQTGNSLGQQLLKALGIREKYVLELSIGMKSNELATVTIVRALDKLEGDELAKVLEQYTLTAKPEDPNAQAMETVARNLMKSHGGGAAT